MKSTQGKRRITCLERESKGRDQSRIVVGREKVDSWGQSEQWLDDEQDLRVKYREEFRSCDREEKEVPLESFPSVDTFVEDVVEDVVDGDEIDEDEIETEKDRLVVISHLECIELDIHSDPLQIVPFPLEQIFDDANWKTIDGVDCDVSFLILNDLFAIPEILHFHSFDFGVSVHDLCRFRFPCVQNVAKSVMVTDEHQGQSLAVRCRQKMKEEVLERKKKIEKRSDQSKSL